MVDTFSKNKRSEIMAANRSSGNKSTEGRLTDLLISSGISGWRVHPTDITGKPDFVFDSRKLVVFVDGCFWHGCKKCRHLPKTNTEFWENKLKTNIARDKRVARQLRRQGWHVLRIWKHELKKSPQNAIRRILRKLNQGFQSMN
jgi:DNA mismatch endonuclease (patch repair protein)